MPQALRNSPRRQAAAGLTIGPGFIVLAMVGLTWVTLLAGCGPRRIGGSTPVDRVIDDLRARNAALQRKVEELETELQLAAQRQAAMDQQAARPVPAVEGVRPADLPALTALRFDGLTGAFDSDGDGRPDTLRVYLHTLDQKGRFIPVAGRAVLQAVAIEPGRPPLLLVERTFEPAELDRCYRSGFTGTHYTLEARLPGSGPQPRQITVKVTLTDASTGVTVAAEQPVPLR